MQAVFDLAVLKEPQSIRILTLEPGEYGQPLHGRLAAVRVEEAGNYEPLSYVWGDPARMHQLRCQNGNIELTKSVYDALQRLRPQQGQRRLWIDQICINQDDKTERSQQVRFMNTIYKKAARVLVWLGEDEEGMAAPAFGLVNTLARTFDDYESRTKFDDDYLENISHLSIAEWNPLKALVNRIWFTRTWIVQEIGTNAPATLFWGDASIEWHEVHKVCEELTTYHQLRKTFDINTAEMKYIYQRFVEPDRTSRHANRFNFIYELHRARHLKVTDPRDRVFAFLGHYSIRESSNTSLRELAADYNIMTVEEVYTDVATRALHDENEPLVTLAAVQHMSLPSKSDTRQLLESQNIKLPTWVPDWRTFQGHILSEPTSPHHASATRKVDLKVNPNKNILHIRGIMIDTITKSSDYMRDKQLHIYKSSSQDYQPPAIESLWTTIAGKTLPFNLDDKYINGDPAILAYMQVLSNGCIATWWRQQAKLPEQSRQPYHAIADAEWLSHGAAYLAAALPPDKLAPDLLALAAKTRGSASLWSRAANGASKHRRFARTEKGFYVLGPGVLEEGDVVVVLFGGKMPFCLRPWGDQFLLVGECYVHGMMNGEVFDSTGPIKGVEQVFQVL